MADLLRATSGQAFPEPGAIVFERNGGAISQQSRVNFVDGGGVTWAVADDGPGARANVQATFTGLATRVALSGVIDLTAAGPTLLYTPTGNLVVTGLLLEVLASVGLVSDPDVELAHAGPGTIYPAQAVPGLLTGRAFEFPCGGVQDYAPPATAVNLGVATPATATQLDVRAHLFGIDF